jgi:hypothetical protein
VPTIGRLKSTLYRPFKFESPMLIAFVAEYRNLFAGLLAVPSAQREADGSSTRGYRRSLSGTGLPNAAVSRPYRRKVWRR